MLGIQRLDRLERLSGSKAVAAATIGAIAIAMCAQIAFYLPGNPVPVTLQVFGVICCGMILGPKIGILAVMEYLTMGLCGLPVFSGFTAGLKGILGPTGGYLAGFILAAGVTGYLARKCDSSDYRRLVLAGLAGVAVIYAFGAAWLRVWLAMTGMDFNGWTAWILGVAPFMLLDTVKVSIAALISRNK